MPSLILVRHAQSLWNLENRFTGWVDVPLTDLGRQEARLAGEKLRDVPFQIAYTSSLRRAQDTLKEMLDSSGQTTPVISDPALNERHYGDLQGLNKAEIIALHGAAQVQIWRRSFDTAPPNGESLKDTAGRTIPFLQRCILGDIRHGKSVLVVAHGNSNRSIVMDLEKLTKEQVLTVELGTAIPLVYELTEKCELISKKTL